MKKPMLKPFKFKITETYEHEFMIFAEDKEKAETELIKKYTDGDLELTDEDFVEWEIYSRG